MKMHRNKTNVTKLLLTFPFLLFPIFVYALPFGFNYLDPHEKYKDNETLKTKGPICIFNETGIYKISGGVPFSTVEDYDLVEEINKKLSNHKIYLDFEKLQTDAGIKDTYKFSIYANDKDIELFKSTFRNKQREYILNVTIQHPAKAYCCNFEPL
ncbi:hypothetical protein [Endozoicomonas sp.]|uniref:hypothetical protein n=1 Tax=Endozoicomonas sp. TaxID=1892382 RepID=UPI003AF68616